MRIRYRDNMSEAETAALLAECEALDAAYAAAYADEAAYWAMVLEYDDPELHEIDRADDYRGALDHKGRP